MNDLTLAELWALANAVTQPETLCDMWPLGKPGETIRIMPPGRFTVRVQITKPATEPLRPALTWNTPASIERFPGFSVQSETHPDEPTPVHALQRLAEGDPRCGSAWLLGR